MTAFRLMFFSRAVASIAGRITTGCGGGYAILATDRDDIPGAFKIRVKR